jgi:AmiR/NasT family two-component response regulator
VDAVTAGRRVVIARTQCYSSWPDQAAGGAGFEVAATADGGRPAGLVEREQPDVVIVDVRMPPTHTDEGIRPRW